MDDRSRGGFAGKARVDVGEFFVVHFDGAAFDEPADFLFARENFRRGKQVNHACVGRSRGNERVPRKFRNIGAHLFFRENVFELLAFVASGFFSVEFCGERGGELLFHFHRMLVFHRGDFRGRFFQKQFVVNPHRGVGNAHHFAEHVFCGIVQRDVVPVAFGHFAFAVQADEKRHCNHGLLRHSRFFLKLAADKIVEKLVGPADFDIALQLDGIAALQERVKEFDNRNRRFRGVALREVVAFEHTRHGHLSGELQRVDHRPFAEPFAVAADFGFFRIENFKSLIEVGFCVGFDFFNRQNRARGTASGRIADARRKIADDEHRLVPQILELAQFVENDHVPESQVGTRGIDAEFYAEFLARLDAFNQLFFTEKNFGALFQKCNLLCGVHQNEIVPRV